MAQWPPYVAFLKPLVHVAAPNTGDEKTQMTSGSIESPGWVLPHLVLKVQGA
jgi:hypothetical protein